MGKSHNRNDQEVERAEAPVIFAEGPYDLGLDISTNCTGLTLLTATGKLACLQAFKLGPKFPTLWDKADEMERLLRNLQIPTGSVRRIFVEENAKRFSAQSSADTVLTLAKFNGIICYLSRKIFGCEIQDVNVISARSKLGYKVKGKNQKDQVFQQTLAMHPEFPWITHVVKGQTVFNAINKDMNDSFVIVKAGQLLFPLHPSC